MFALGIRIMRRAEFKSTSRSPCNPAVLYRDGLMIALLSSCPIRLPSVLGMKVGQHLLRRGEVYWVVIEEQTKTRRPVEVPLPKALTEAFDRFIGLYRPLLLRRSRGSALEEAQALWISARSRVLSQSAARFRLTTTTKRELGASIGPQLFRDCVAHAIASKESEHAHIAAVILGHATRATAEHHCVRARTVEAARCYQNFLVDLRRRWLNDERIGDEPSRQRKSRESVNC
jgi:integrase